MRHVLLIEDDDAIAGLVTIVLGEDGLDVTRVADVAEGARRIDEAPPDLVLLDLTLPGVPGRVYLERRARNPRLAAIPVIVMSALTFRPPPGAPGPDAVIRKPFDIDDLSDAVRDCLAARRLAERVPA